MELPEIGKKFVSEVFNRLYPNEYLVLRHGGSSRNRWRVIDSFFKKEFAENLYAATVMMMRQGGVIVIDPNRIVIRTHFCPRLRTKW